MSSEHKKGPDKKRDMRVTTKGFTISSKSSHVPAPEATHTHTKHKDSPRSLYFWQRTRYIPHVKGVGKG